MVRWQLVGFKANCQRTIKGAFSYGKILAQIARVGYLAPFSQPWQIFMETFNKKWHFL